jgi:hypothetical protein
MLADLPEPTSESEYRKQQLKVGAHVASILGNNRSQALESYIDPTVFGPPPTKTPKGDSEPAGQAGRDALRHAFDNGVEEGDELTGGNMNLSIRRVTLSDGTQAVLKRPRDHGEHRREVVSGIIQNALGLDGHTTDAGDGQLLTTFVHGEPGALHSSGVADSEFVSERSLADLEARLARLHTQRQQLGENEYAFHVAQTEAAIRQAQSGVKHTELPGAREIGVMDWLIRNRDRHDLNYIVTPEGRVQPIDHGLTFFSPVGADRDVPLSPFSDHWLGLTQRSTPRPARGKGHDEALDVKGPKVKLSPRVSQQYVRELRRRLELSRDEFSETEWAGIIARLDLLEHAAPESVEGEEPLGEMT